MKRLAIFASGNGSNAENIIRFLKSRNVGWTVAVVVCNKPGAYVMERARKYDVPVELMPKAVFNNKEELLGVMDRYAVDAVVLAGFLLMVPDFLLERYPDCIINIHPSLLPKYGGKGMYGHHVHEAVVAAGERQSGITIHLVNEECDGGRILMQATTEVTADDTPESVEAKIHQLEQKYYPAVIASTLTGISLNELVEGD